MTLLRSLVELHHGRVEAQSDGPGRGSVFTVRLPLATHAVASSLADMPAPPPAVRTAVIVEDQDDSREMLRILLETDGLTVHTAGDGVEGATLIERLRPDVARSTWVSP